MTKPCSIAPAPALEPLPDSPRRVTGSYLQPLLDAATARGVTPDALARGAGLPLASVSPLPDSLPATDYVTLLEAGALLANDPHFGLHVGECVKLGTYSVYGLVLLACRDLRQALEQTMRYEALAHELGRSQIEVGVKGELARYAWISHYPQASRHLVESVFAGIQTFGRWLAGGQLPPAQVEFMHASDAPMDEYQRVFGGRPRFGAPANTAQFDAALLALPVPNADVGMYPVLQQHAERLLSQRTASQAAIVDQVRAAIIRNLAQDRVRLPAIAEELGLSPRTLQRKLSEAGASYQAVLDGARFALAQDYLRQPGLSLADIAFLLGYQEQSAFTHAFKEWSGLNPGAWRERAA
ncbi:AraC family transcriptional regulator [Massilia haematophila]|uniref:AraC family transcriptional regulator n=1 Tax=Massilia haematophila TaxID=457923 RepID=A0ABV7PHS0_9BURK